MTNQEIIDEFIKVGKEIEEKYIVSFYHWYDEESDILTLKFSLNLFGNVADNNIYILPSVALWHDLKPEVLHDVSYSFLNDRLLDWWNGGFRRRSCK